MTIWNHWCNFIFSDGKRILPKGCIRKLNLKAEKATYRPLSLPIKKRGKELGISVVWKRLTKRN